MDRPDLELVLAVRQHGSLVKAAQALRVAPSAVTKRLAALETRLGLRLFQRTTRRVSPTAEGETLCERAEALLRGFDAVLWSVILGLVVVITFPASSLFYGQGARSQLRAAERQKARGRGAK